MTVSTFYSTSTDGYAQGQGTTFLRAQDALDGFAYAGGGNTFGYAGNAKFGATDFYVMQGFIGFDTSSIPDANTISSAVLSLYGNADNSSTNFILEAAAFDWSGSGVTSADFRNKSAANALTSVAAYNLTGGWSLAAYNDFSSVSPVSVINKTGTTYFVLYSQNDRLNVAPTTDEYVTFWLGADGTRQPRLVVTHTGAASYSMTTVDSMAVTDSSVKVVTNAADPFDRMGYFGL